MMMTSAVDIGNTTKSAPRVATTESARTDIERKLMVTITRVGKAALKGAGNKRTGNDTMKVVIMMTTTVEAVAGTKSVTGRKTIVGISANAVESATRTAASPSSRVMARGRHGNEGTGAPIVEVGAGLRTMMMMAPIIISTRNTIVAVRDANGKQNRRSRSRG